MVMDIGIDNFKQEVLENNLPVLVDFWAPWCGPCMALAPYVNKIATKYEGKLKVVKINTDQNEELAAKYEIMSIPTLILFKNGKEVERLIGSRPGEIEEMIRKGGVLI